MVERGGEPVAEIVPHPAPVRFTGADLLLLVQSLPAPDDQWAEDLEDLRKHQGVLPGDPWASS